MENRSDGSTSILVMGILSLSLCWIYGIGLIFAIIGLVKSGNYMKYYPLYGKAKAGRIMSIIGLIVNIIFLVIMCLAVGIAVAAS